MGRQHVKPPSRKTYSSLQSANLNKKNEPTKKAASFLDLPPLNKENGDGLHRLVALWLP